MQAFEEKALKELEAVDIPASFNGTKPLESPIGSFHLATLNPKPNPGHLSSVPAHIVWTMGTPALRG